MSRRLVTDAKIVLERAGYEVTSQTVEEMVVREGNCYYSYAINGGTINNANVVELLARRGYNEFGYRRD